MRICFIGHSHHRSTQSHLFFLKILRRLGQVEVFFDESWRLHRADWIDQFDSSAYDCIVIWQVQEALGYVREPHPNLIFVPMYDALVGGNLAWSEALNSAKILCFSSALYKQVADRTPHSIYAQYFPDPNCYPQVSNENSLRGFFWQRVPAITPRLVAHLCGDSILDRFTVHFAPDPLSGIQRGIERAVRAKEHQVSFWRAVAGDHLKSLATHNILFASRPSEGIGMSFLEAMAMGLCVIAPDLPTHNEYIRNGVTGLLYDPDNPEPQPLSRVQEIGAQARESIRTGYATWTAMQDRLSAFIRRRIKTAELMDA